MTPEQVIQIVQDYLKASAFQDRKITDTPTDANSVVPRKFVTANGSTANRPPAPVTGQFYYDTTIHLPIWWNGSVWKDAQNNTV